MPGLIGKKIGMTSVFSAEGKNVPCTVLEVGPCIVTQIKTKEIVKKIFVLLESANSILKKCDAETIIEIGNGN